MDTASERNSTMALVYSSQGDPLPPRDWQALRIFLECLGDMPNSFLDGRPEDRTDERTLTGS